MPASKHWLDIMDRVDRFRVDDSLRTARITLETDSLKDLLKRSLADPSHPANWHRRRVDDELSKPEVARLYFTIKRSLWTWPEFAEISRRAMTILQVVTELAREEALPWWVAVSAEDVRRLARMSTRQYVRAVHELEGLAITRPARPIHLAGPDGTSRFPGVVDESKPASALAQWVLRYRHGTPWHKKRAAWWINYDLVCGTQRVYQCFIVSPKTLSKPYRSRFKRMGRRVNIMNAAMNAGDMKPNANLPFPLGKGRGEGTNLPLPPGAGEGRGEGMSDSCASPDTHPDSTISDDMIALETILSTRGPLPPEGLRAPLWRPETRENRIRDSISLRPAGRHARPV